MSCVIDLTSREKQVLQMLAEGKQPEDIAGWHTARYLHSAGLVHYAGPHRYRSAAFVLSLRGVRLVRSGFQTTGTRKARAL